MNTLILDLIKFIFVPGLPHPVVFKSQSTSQARDSFNLSWSVNSYSPIEIYRLYYRKAVPGAEPDPSPPPRKGQKKVSERLELNKINNHIKPLESKKI